MENSLFFVILFIGQKKSLWGGSFDFFGFLMILQTIKSEDILFVLLENEWVENGTDIIPLNFIIHIQTFQNILWALSHN